MKRFICALIAVSALLLPEAEAARSKRQRRQKPTPAAATLEAEAAEPLVEPQAKPVEPEPVAAEPTGGLATAIVPAEAPPAPGALPTIELGVHLRGFQRRLRFSDDLFERFHPHSVSGPAMGFDATIYRWRHVGFVGRGHYALGLRTRDEAGRDYDTEAYSLQGGLTTRWQLGSVTAGAGLVLGLDHVGLESPGLPPRSGVVSTTLQYVRPEVSARSAVGGGLEAFGSLGYMVLLSAGELQTAYFDEVAGGGIALSAGLAYPLAQGLEARLEADYRRFFFSMSPQPGDDFVAGGATDETLGLVLGLQYRM